MTSNTSCRNILHRSAPRSAGPSRRKLALFIDPSEVTILHMCYSAQVIQMARKLHRQLGIRLDYAEIEKLFFRRLDEPNRHFATTENGDTSLTSGEGHDFPHLGFRNNDQIPKRCSPTDPCLGLASCGLDKLDHDGRAADNRMPALAGFQGGVHSCTVVKAWTSEVAVPTAKPY